MIPNPICRLCGEPMAAMTKGGCVAFPFDKQQIVCAQHYINQGFLDGGSDIWVDSRLIELGY